MVSELQHHGCIEGCLRPWAGHLAYVVSFWPNLDVMLHSLQALNDSIARGVQQLHARLVMVDISMKI